MNTIQTSSYMITLSGNLGPFSASLTSSTLAPGLEEVHLLLQATQPSILPPLRLEWTHPAVDIHAHWNPLTGPWRGVDVYWGEMVGRRYPSKATSGAPVIVLHSYTGLNRLTFAFSDALNPLTVRAALVEETAIYNCSVDLFHEPGSPIQQYQASLRLDTRPLPYYESLEDISRWWAAMPEYRPARVPEVARLPMYSSWYSFHQAVDPGAIEDQCRQAKALGCEAVIVDDGWQTDDNSRGYAYCGDWEPALSKIPDMQAHVARVHQIGMKYLLWYSVPFMGPYAKNYPRFEGKFLHQVNWGNWYVLDPRFPEVREYLIGLYERAVGEWDIDGLKLDFVDSFDTQPYIPAGSPPPPQVPEDAQSRLQAGWDYTSVPMAVDRLLTDTIERLRRIKPEVMVEFRQSYIGPLMRKYGNMFRSGDCPADSLSNRLHTLDIRLLCGDTAAHSDMLMWHPEEAVESAALQFTHILFSVPQVSMLLDKLPARHLEMVRFWLRFWREHRDVLLDGKLMPLHPELFYPLVLAETSQKLLAAVYASQAVPLGTSLPPQLLLVNAKLEENLVLDLVADLGTRRLEVFDCTGGLVSQEQVSLSAGLHRLQVPPAGVVLLSS